MSRRPSVGRPGRLRPVGPHVLVATSSFESTTTGVIVGPDHTAVLVDPGVSPGELDSLARDLAGLGLRVVAGISTHPHWDHLLWHPSWQHAPRFLHPDALERVRFALPAMVAEAEAAVPGSAAALADLAGVGVADLRPLSSGLFPWDGAPVQVLVHRAHAPGHLALVVGEGQQRVVLAGDMLSDVEIPLLDLDAPDPVGDYRTALARLSRLADPPGIAWVVPGHGRSGTDLEARIAADVAYLDALARDDGPGSDASPADPRLVGASTWMTADHAGQRLRVRSRGPN